VVTAAIRWGEIGVAEESRVEESGELAEILTVVPAVVDRREVTVFLAQPDGGYRPAAEPLPLPLSVISLEAGPPAVPLLALTDQGVSALRLAGGELRLEPLLEEPPVLAGAGAFLPGLGLLRRLTGDELPELLLPGRRGLAVFRGTAQGFSRRPAALFPVPGEAAGRAGPLERLYPLPAVQDVTGDGLPDLVFRDPRQGWNRVRVMVNDRQGRFRKPIELAVRRGGAGSPEGVFFGDLDGDGRAELVTRQEMAPAGGSLRKEMAAAREPKSRLRLYRVGADFKVAAKPYQTLEVTGYGIEGGAPLLLGLRDLNGDGRLDLATATLDLTFFKALRSLATRRLDVGVELRLWCQGTGGMLRPVGRRGPEGRFRFDLNDVKLAQVALFSGDFDGDGRPDFLAAGKGRQVAIHRGRPDCSFPAKPDLALELAEEPRDVTLLQARDLDGDGRADLAIAQPGPPGEPGFSRPARLDLYLSRAVAR
jgi:VCBS repeat protein